MKNLLSFTAGVIVGAVCTWKLLESRCENRIQEEVDSVKEAFANRDEDKVEDEPTEAENATRAADFLKKKMNVVEYTNKIKENGYVNYSDYSSKEEKKEAAPVDKPYVISPEQLGDFDDYEIISLTYYADGVLTDENNEVIDDVDDIVGEESLEHFGEYENDAVHVRNDARKCDYEILLDTRDFDDVKRTMPQYSAED